MVSNEECTDLSSIHLQEVLFEADGLAGRRLGPILPGE
jgi:hypothetical protein